MQVADVDAIIDRMSSHKGVLGVIVATKDGIPLKTTLDNTATVLYIGGLQGLADKCESIVREVEPADKLEYLRITTSRFEIMSAPRDDHVAIAVQQLPDTKNK